MLLSLHLRDFALIDSLSLDFFPGMNVLTGETGAGKSILIGALGLVLGERASAEQVRSGARHALIEAVFSPPANVPELYTFMEENGLQCHEEIVISREISLNGRNLCRINGRVVPLVILKETGSFLVDMHGQHSHQSLLKPDQHLLLLDEFGDECLFVEKNRFQQLFTRWQEINRMLLNVGRNVEERKNQLELLTYQRQEILDACLSEEEEENLEKRLALLNNLEKILLIVNNAYANIYSGTGKNISIVDSLNSIREDFISLQKIDPAFNNYVNYLDEATANLSELGHELFNYQDNLAYYPEERTEIENRLEIYHHLKRKFKGTVSDILSLAEKYHMQIKELEESEEKALALEKEKEKLQIELKNSAANLSALRKATAQKLKEQVEITLKDLGIQAGIFTTAFKPREKAVSSGTEEIEFLFSANPGEDPKPLAKIISAGEMARVMLALKSILAEQDRIPTLIFDEIDSGIGGKTIQQVAQKMADLSQKHQVICVTHNPHIASIADHQYFIYKEVADGRSSTRVEYLQGENRTLEIARMLDGSNTDITRKHAEELLQRRMKR